MDFSQNLAQLSLARVMVSEQNHCNTLQVLAFVNMLIDPEHCVVKYVLVQHMNLCCKQTCFIAIFLEGNLRKWKGGKGCDQ